MLYDNVPMPRVLDLGYSYSQPFWHAAQPVLDRISTQLGLPSSGAVLSLPDVVFTIRAPTQVGTALVSVGTRLAAWPTALGRAMLADLPESELASYLQSVDLNPFTPFTVVDHDALLEAILQVRRVGYAVSDRQYDIGVRALAVPVRNRAGVAVAAIDVAVDPRMHAIETLVETAFPVLDAAAREISGSLPV